MNILITGGSGFIGSHLSEKLLINGENKLFLLDNLLTGSVKNIEHLDKDKVVFIEHDVQDHIEIDEKIDYVFHFASAALVWTGVLIFCKFMILKSASTVPFLPSSKVISVSILQCVFDSSWRASIRG